MSPTALVATIKANWELRTCPSPLKMFNLPLLSVKSHDVTVEVMFWRDKLSSADPVNEVANVIDRGPQVLVQVV
jgi:hypothetical protein